MAGINRGDDDIPNVRIATGQDQQDQGQFQGQAPQQANPSWQHGGPPGQNRSPQQAPQQMTADEQRILRECNQEAFFRRSIPFSVIGAMAAFSAGRAGMLRANPTYGHGPKMVVAGICGYFLGKFSYINECADKFLVQLPDSQVAKAIRQRRGMPPRESDLEQEPQADMFPEQQQQDPNAFPMQQEEEGEEGSGKPKTTYDDLRRQYREQYRRDQDKRQSIQPPFPQQQQPQQQQQQPGQPFDETPDTSDPMYAPPSKLRKKPTNKYGDEGFE